MKEKITITITHTYYKMKNPMALTYLNNRMNTLQQELNLQTKRIKVVVYFIKHEETKKGRNKVGEWQNKEKELKNNKIINK